MDDLIAAVDARADQLGMYSGLTISLLCCGLDD